MIRKGMAVVFVVFVIFFVTKSPAASVTIGKNIGNGIVSVATGFSDLLTRLAQ